MTQRFSPLLFLSAQHADVRQKGDYDVGIYVFPDGWRGIGKHHQESRSLVDFGKVLGRIVPDVGFGRHGAISEHIRRAIGSVAKDLRKPGTVQGQSSGYIFFARLSLDAPFWLYYILHAHGAINVLAS